MSVRIINADVMAGLAELPSESVHCVVTSPPYWGLRDYGVAGQIGLEDSPAAYVAKMVDVFREVHRVLRRDGTLWLNMGDSYATGAGRVGDCPGGGEQGQRWRGEGSKHDYGRAINTVDKKRYSGTQPNRMPQVGLKPKDLCGIPWMLAFALRADGWWLRQDIIWSKPNPMPESIKDRCTKAHEYLFLLTKAERYYFDAEAIAETIADSSQERLTQPNLKHQRGSDRAHAGGKTNGAMKAVGTPRNDGSRWNENDGRGFITGGTRNKRSVWEVATAPFSEAHFATFPPALIEPCIKAGTSERGCCAKCAAPWVRQTERVDQGWDGSKYGTRAVAASGGAVTGGTAKSTLGSGNGKLTGKSETIGWSPSCNCQADTIACTVLDPFCGSGTTGMVADRLKRNAILIELNPEYAAMAARRIKGDSPLFAHVEGAQASPSYSEAVGHQE